MEDVTENNIVKFIIFSKNQKFNLFNNNFILTLYNLNYSVNVPQYVLKDVPQGDLDTKILDLIKNMKITRRCML